MEIELSHHHSRRFKRGLLRARPKIVPGLSPLGGPEHMPRRKKQHVHLKKAAEKKKQRSNGVAFKKPPGYAAVVQNAIRATPVAIPRMCKLLRLEATRSILLWVGCGCGEEIFAILRRVRHLYVVALEHNKDDLATFRTTLVKATGVVPVAKKTDVFALRRNGAKVRLVHGDAGLLSNEELAGLAPGRFTHLFSFAIGPTGPCGWALHNRLVEFGWQEGLRAVLPLNMWQSAGFLPQTLASIGDVHKASWYTSGAAQTFAFVAIDLPASKPLTVGAKVRTRFQDNNGEPDPPTNHEIYMGKVTKTSDDGFFVDVKCDLDQTISKRTPQWWASLAVEEQEQARWTRGA
jgi:SAM-dependent methyltransferase